MLPAFPVEQEYQPLVRLAARGQQFDPLELLCTLGRMNRSMEDFLRDVARLQRSLDGSAGDLPFPPPRSMPVALAGELLPNALG
jgi:hypothetical protein